MACTCAGYVYLLRTTSERVKRLQVLSTIVPKVIDGFDNVLKTTHPHTSYDHYEATVLARKTISERKPLQRRET